MRRIHPLLIALSLCLAACRQQANPPPASSPDAAATAMPAGISPAAVKPPDALASHNTNWAGVVADVTECRRKGNTLTALVRFRNNSSGSVVVEFRFKDAYLMDEAGAKKYEVLKDEKGGYIASSSEVLTQYVGGGQSMTVWMKFPAPPLEAKTVTLAMPQMPPFENLPIQDQ